MMQAQSLWNRFLDTIMQLIMIMNGHRIYAHCFVYSQVKQIVLPTNRNQTSLIKESPSITHNTADHKSKDLSLQWTNPRLVNKKNIIAVIANTKRRMNSSRDIWSSTNKKCGNSKNLATGAYLFIIINISHLARRWKYNKLLVCLVRISTKLSTRFWTQFSIFLKFNSTDFKPKLHEIQILNKNYRTR